MSHDKKISTLIEEFKKEGIHTIYSKIITYSSISGKFETECVLERYFKTGDIEDKFTTKTDAELVEKLIRKLAELRILKKERTVLRLN